MNAQLIFDVVLFGIRQQGGGSFSQGSGSCFYRGPEGRRCALGMWISDSAYEPSMEGHGVAWLLQSDYFKDKLPSWFREHSGLLSALQAAHDRAANERAVKAPFFATWEDEMRTIARCRHLIYTPPGHMLTAEAEATYWSINHGERAEVPTSPRRYDAFSHALSKEVPVGAYSEVD
jgi:hypothetical protein